MITVSSTVEERFRYGGLVMASLHILARTTKDAFEDGAEEADIRPLLASLRDDLVGEVAWSVPAKPGQTDVDAYCGALPDAERAYDAAMAILYP